MRKFFKSLACMFAAMFAATPVYAADSDKWVVVNLDTPGNLGVEILYQADKLADVTHLRISGEINSDDWTTIKNLSNIEALDLENTVTNSVPQRAFIDRKSLVSVIFPKTLKSIENYAFSSTSLEELNFPASLETIDESAFSSSKVKNVKFAQGNRLKSMGDHVFSYCDSLLSVSFSEDAEINKIPNRTFYYCRKLSSVNIPQTVTRIGYDAFYENNNLTHIDLPENLNFIGSSAFSYANLQEIELPSTLHYLDQGSVFYGNKNLKKVICKSPNPPVANINDRTFSDITQITLIVPDFAVPAYKLDPYWLGFGNIQGGAKSDFWDIAGPLSLNNDHRLDGTPSLTIQGGGSLTVIGNAAMPVDRLIMNYDQSDYYVDNFLHSQLINNSPIMTANSVDIKYSIYGNRWHFISLPFDVKVNDIRHSVSTAEFVVRYYDGAERASANKTGQSWKDVPAGTVIKAGTGFIIQSNESGEITFPCADDGKSTIFNPNSVTMELAANIAESNEHTGWNLVANPYPCYYDMYHSMLSCPITVYNPKNRNYIAYSLIDDIVVLWPGRPFFIQASDDIKEIVFSNAGRQLSPESNRASGAPALTGPAGSRDLFEISLSCNGFIDRSRVVINPDASDTYEFNRDASKFFSDNTDIPQIYTISSDDTRLAINERDEADGTVRLGIYAPAPAEMVLSMPRIDGQATLYDAETDRTIVFAEGDSYRFNASAAGFDNDRFTLMLKARGTTALRGITDDMKATVTADGYTIRISDAEGRHVTISSAEGKVYVNETVKSDRIEYTLPRGLYIVKAGAASYKCFIR